MDATGVRNTGSQAAGGARQESGTAGRVATGESGPAKRGCPRRRRQGVEAPDRASVLAVSGQEAVRSGTGWSRQSTWARWAYALVSGGRARHLQDALRSTIPAGAGAATPPAGVHSRAAPRVPRRVPAMRRLFGRLVRATRHPIGQMLDCSAWRRWHQGVAQYYHDKRRSVLQLQL